MTAFACYWPWLLGGAALGWLGWQLFDRLFRRDGEEAGLRWKRDLDGATTTISRLQNDLSGANSRISTLTGDWEKASALVKMKTDEASSLGGELVNWKAKFADFEGKAAAAAAAAAVTAAASMKGADEKYATLAASLKSAEDKYATCAASLKSAEDKHASIALSLKSADDKYALLQVELENAQKALRVRTDDVARLTTELADCKARYAAFEVQSKQSLAAVSAVATAASFGYKPQRNGKDDLTIVEGIGPKINELLLAGGIDTFESLARTPIARIQEILDAAGPTFRIANPSTWPTQSALCARGAWEELKALQDRLDAGVEPDAKERK